MLSCAVNFGLDAKSLEKLLMYIIKNNGPSIEPCGTPVSVVVQEQYYLFRTTLYCHGYNKSQHLVNYMIYCFL